jgi:hypothetical protein
LTDYAKRNTTNTFTLLNTFNVGITSAGATFTNTVTIYGNLNATTKSFVIPHPMDEGKTLRYGSLEGPENGVYVRGRLTGHNIIDLPDYWINLVDQDSKTVNLTPIGSDDLHFVELMGVTNVVINSKSGQINCYYMVLGERKDVPKLEVEY